MFSEQMFSLSNALLASKEGNFHSFVYSPTPDSDFRDGGKRSFKDVRFTHYVYHNSASLSLVGLIPEGVVVLEYTRSIHPGEMTGTAFIYPSQYRSVFNDRYPDLEPLEFPRVTIPGLH